MQTIVNNNVKGKEEKVKKKKNDCQSKKGS
jgi:hypothetical protein